MNFADRFRIVTWLLEPLTAAQYENIGYPELTKVVKQIFNIDVDKRTLNEWALEANVSDIYSLKKNKKEDLETRVNKLENELEGLKYKLEDLAISVKHLS